MVYETFVFAVILIVSANVGFTEIIQREGKTVPLAKGETAPDHMKHLHGMYSFLNQIKM
ncbi:MAG: hypothetical protein P9L94_07160 [Candidatus Hinthialibacter antarcticus]|nr:hypothetical protein [Candidatus Hinthialibacter antarcticus]